MISQGPREDYHVLSTFRLHLSQNEGESLLDWPLTNLKDSPWQVEKKSSLFLIKTPETDAATYYFFLQKKGPRYLGRRLYVHQKTFQTDHYLHTNAVKYFVEYNLLGKSISIPCLIHSENFLSLHELKGLAPAKTAWISGEILDIHNHPKGHCFLKWRDSHGAIGEIVTPKPLNIPSQGSNPPLFPVIFRAEVATSAHSPPSLLRFESDPIDDSPQ